MFRKGRMTVIAVGMLMGVGVTALSPVAEAQGVQTVQTIVAILRSLGDTTRSWSIAWPAAERFRVLNTFNGEAVLDRNTGLVWERTPEHGARPWHSAKFACMNAKTGGQMGWRMPSISELSSLLDTVQTNPALPAGHPFTLGGHAFFWTVTRRAGFTDLAWGANVRDGFIDDYETFTLSLSTWCVRGGTDADEY